MKYIKEYIKTSKAFSEFQTAKIKMEYEGGKGKTSLVVKAQKVIHAMRTVNRLLLVSRKLGSKGTFIAKGQPMFLRPHCSGTSANLLFTQIPEFNDSI